MRRLPWRARPAGRHAAGARGPGSGTTDNRRTGETAPAPPRAALEQAIPPWASAGHPDAPVGLLGAPTAADAVPLVSPVTDAARAASAGLAESLPRHVAPGNNPVVTVDALGRKCPIPIILLAQQINDVPVGSVIAVLADDPAAYADIPAWCGLKSHECVYRADHASGWAFGVRRRY